MAATTRTISPVIRSALGALEGRLAGSGFGGLTAAGALGARLPALLAESGGPRAVSLRSAETTFGAAA
jgi:hypothetical protein